MKHSQRSCGPSPLTLHLFDERGVPAHDEAIDHNLEEVLLALEASIEERSRHAGERDDIFDRRLREAVMTEHLDGGRNDSLGPSILETEWTDVSGGTDAFRQKRSKRNK